MLVVIPDIQQYEIAVAYFCSLPPNQRATVTGGKESLLEEARRLFLKVFFLPTFSQYCLPQLINIYSKLYLIFRLGISIYKTPPMLQFPLVFMTHNIITQTNPW